MKGRAALLLLLVARAAWGEGWVHAPVEVSIDSCIDVRAGEVQRIVGIELGATGEAPWPETVRVRAGCAEKLVKIEVDDPITRKSLSRQIDLAAAAGPARARLLALAIAELVAASWTELESNPEPRVKPAGAEPSASAKRGALQGVHVLVPTPTPFARVRILAEATLRTFTTEFGPLLGGGGRLAMDFRYFGWWVEVSGDHGTARPTDLTIDGDTLSVTVGLYGRIGWSRIAARGGLGVRMGAAFIHGRWNDPTKGEALPPGTAFWGGGLVTVGATVAATRTVAIELALEGGYMPGAVNAKIQATDLVVARLAGPWFGLTLGGGFFP